MSRNAIIGFGSLLSNPRNLAMEGDWHANGAELPLEFSRIRRDGALVLCIDEQQGRNCKTYWVKSSFTDVEDTIANLAERENVEIERIGHINRNGNSLGSSRHPRAITSITSWMRQNRDIDNVLWCDLGPKFYDKIRVRFSIPNALRYYNELESEIKQTNRDYILTTPFYIDTLFRRAFAETMENNENESVVSERLSSQRVQREE